MVFFIVVQVGGSLASFVLTLKAAVAGDLGRGAQGLGNQVPIRAMFEHVPVVGLVLDLQQRCLPAHRRPLAELWGGCIFLHSPDPLWHATCVSGDLMQFEQEMRMEDPPMEDPPSTIAARARALQEMLHEDRLGNFTLRETDALVTLTHNLQSVLDTRKHEASVKFIPWGFAL